MPGPAAPPPSPPPPPPFAVDLHAGLGVGRYHESAVNVDFECDLQPTVQVGGNAAWPLGRGQLVVQAVATLGLQTSMHASSNGMVVQQNDFRQEVGELSPQLRWPLGPKLDVELGYRFTVQRLEFLGIPNLGDAVETVMVHAAELGLGWHRIAPDGSGVRVEAGFGLNYGSPDNNRIDGEHFSASGHSFRFAVERRWRRGLAIDVVFALRAEHGSDSEQVTVDGMPTTAVWPENTTWTSLAAVGYGW